MRKTHRTSLLGLATLALTISACAPMNHGSSQITSRYGAPVTVHNTTPTLRSDCNIQLKPCGVISHVYRVDHIAYVPSTVCCGIPHTMTPPPLPPVIETPAPDPIVFVTPEPVPEPPVYVPPVYVEPPVAEPPVYIAPPQHWPTPETPYEPPSLLRK